MAFAYAGAFDLAYIPQDLSQVTTAALPASPMFGKLLSGTPLKWRQRQRLNTVLGVTFVACTVSDHNRVLDQIGFKEVSHLITFDREGLLIPCCGAGD